MDVLVTGATGFIGRHLVERLRNDGHHVRALVRPETSVTWLNALGVEIVRGDIGDVHAVERAVENCQVVFHLAAKSEGSGVLSRKDAKTVNIGGTENVARAAVRADVQRFVFCSTVSVYGRDIRNQMITEDTQLRPDTRYGKSKVMSERIVLSHHKCEGLPVIVARISTVLGPGAKSWLGLYRTIASGHFRLIGTGHNRHHFADVSDIVQGLLLCSSVKGVEGRTYILAGIESVEIRQFVQMIGEEVGMTRFRSSLPVTPLYVYQVLHKLAYSLMDLRLPRADRLAFFLGDRSFDISRARQDLGYVPRVGIRETIHRMAGWFRDEGCLPRDR